MGYRYLTIIGDREETLGLFDAIDCVLAFKSEESRRKAEELMLEHRRDDEEISDTENMLNALDLSKIDYDRFWNTSEVWL